MLAILTCIGTPIGLGVNMRVTDAEHTILIEGNSDSIEELKKENKDLKEENKELAKTVAGLSEKIDGIPQKTFDLMNSVNAISNNNSSRGK